MRKLNHNELVGLATNMIHLKGGMKLWNNYFKLNENYSPEKASIINYVNKRGYNPMRIGDFSPFAIDCNNPVQTFPAAVTKRGKINIVDPNFRYDYIPIKKARKMLKTEFRKILKSDDNNIYLLKCATGLGKTQLIKNTKGIIAAFPDHSLKSEHYNQSKLSFEVKKVTPELKGFGKETQEHLMALYKKGFNGIAQTLLQNLADGRSIDGTKKCSKTDEDAATSFLNILEDAKLSNVDQTVFTTHHRALYSEFPQDVIVFDESPLNAFVENGNTTLNDLKVLVAECILQGYDLQELRKILNDEELLKSDAIETPVCNIDNGKLYQIITKLQLKTNVLKFFQSSYFSLEDNEVSYCVFNFQKLPENKKIIIADATASEEVYSRIFGSRLKIIPIANVKNKGRIIQYTSYSCSRSGLVKYHDVILERINKDLQTITFIAAKGYFPNSTPDIHFGKERGTNMLEGQNINVIGTPHNSKSYYVFLAKACNLQVNDFSMKYRPVKYDNKEFTFPTFLDEVLQLIHLQQIEGDILQAIQRARLISYTATVYLYSNFPVNQAEYDWVRGKNNSNSINNNI